MAASRPCPACGQPVSFDQHLCPSCGAPVVEAMGTGAELTPAAAGAPPAAGPLPALPPADLAPGGPLPAGIVPGAYLPPSSVHRPEPSPAVPPAAAQMPLAASPAVGAPPPGSTSGWAPPRDVPTPRAPVKAGRASLFADLPFDAPDSVTEWLVAVGSTVSAVSFLLPWISGTVSYVTSWGLSSISRLPILVLLLMTAVLGILPNRVATWVRSGVLGLVAGSLLLGNIWPIVAGDFGDAAFGAIVAAAAAVVLMVGGILAVAPRRPTQESS